MPNQLKNLNNGPDYTAAPHISVVVRRLTATRRPSRSRVNTVILHYDTSLPQTSAATGNSCTTSCTVLL
jgi:hypothetical protein